MPLTLAVRGHLNHIIKQSKDPGTYNDKMQAVLVLIAADIVMSDGDQPVDGLQSLVRMLIRDLKGANHTFSVLYTAWIIKEEDGILSRGKRWDDDAMIDLLGQPEWVELQEWWNKFADEVSKK